MYFSDLARTNCIDWVPFMNAYMIRLHEMLKRERNPEKKRTAEEKCVSNANVIMFCSDVAHSALIIHGL